MEPVLKSTLCSNESFSPHNFLCWELLVYKFVVTQSVLIISLFFFFAAPVPTGEGSDAAGTPAPVEGAVPPAVAAPAGWDPAAQPTAQGWE